MDVHRQLQEMNLSAELIEAMRLPTMELKQLSETNLRHPVVAAVHSLKISSNIEAFLSILKHALEVGPC